MNEKIKNILLRVLSAIIAFALICGFWILGYFTGNGDDSLYLSLAIACGIVIVIALIANIALSRSFLKKFNDMKMRELYDWSNKLKDDVEKDYNAAEKSVKRTITLAYLYVLFLIVLHLAIAYAVGAMQVEISSYLVAVLICSYSLWGLVDIFFTFPEGGGEDGDTVISEKEYPLLYRTVKLAADKSGCKKPVKLYAAPNGISVTETGGCVAIFVGYMEFAVLTADELYNVMLHEFAHVTNTDAKRGAYFAKEEQRWDSVHEGNNPLTVLSRQLVRLPSELVCFKANMFPFFSSRHYEICADEAVKKLGSPQDYSNALSKTGMLIKFREFPCRELEYDFYAPEKCTGDFAKQEYELFAEYKIKYKDIWTAQLERELPARVASHPVFNQRLQAMGCDSYDSETKENDPDYIQEQKKFLDLCDRILTKRQEEKYGEYRENIYLHQKKIMDEYDEAVSKGETISDGKLLTALQTFVRIDDDKAVSIGEELLKTSPNNAKVNYIMGEILFFRYDKACVNCFKIARGDSLYTESAMDYIGRFALLAGDKELLSEYRSTSPEVMQVARDMDENAVIDRNTEISGCGFTDEQKSSICEGVRQAAGDGLQALYIGKFKSLTGEEHYAIVPVFVSGYSRVNCNNAMTAIDNFFSLWTNVRFMILYADSPAAKLIKKVDGTKIYEATR